MQTLKTHYECDRKGCAAEIIVAAHETKRVVRWLSLLLHKYDCDPTWRLHLCEKHRAELLATLKPAALKDPE